MEAARLFGQSRVRPHPRDARESRKVEKTNDTENVQLASKLTNLNCFKIVKFLHFVSKFLFDRSCGEILEQRFPVPKYIKCQQGGSQGRLNKSSVFKTFFMNFDEFLQNFDKLCCLRFLLAKVNPSVPKQHQMGAFGSHDDQGVEEKIKFHTELGKRQNRIRNRGFRIEIVEFAFKFGFFR